MEKNKDENTDEPKKETTEEKQKQVHTDPLHGVTLKTIVEKLVDFYGWEQLGRNININSFNHDPSVKSSLKFLRKTPWARKKVEDLYIKVVEFERE